MNARNVCRAFLVATILLFANSSSARGGLENIVVILRPAPNANAETGYRFVDGSTLIEPVTTVDPVSNRLVAELLPGPTGNGDDVEEVYITIKDENGNVIRSNCYITFPDEPVNPDSEMVPVFNIVSGPPDTTFVIPQIDVSTLLATGIPSFSVGQTVQVTNGGIVEWPDVVIGDGMGFTSTQDILDANGVFPAFTGELIVAGFDDFVAVPEPCSWMLLATFLACICGGRSKNICR